MSERMIAKMLAPLSRQIGGLVTRGVVALVNSSRKMQAVQLALLADEVKDNLEHFEPYGFTANPLAGAESLAIFLGGDRSHGIVIACADRRYRLTGLVDGEVALYDDQGQSIVLKRNNTIEVNTVRWVVNASEEIVLNSPEVRATGNFVADGDVADQAGVKTMAGMRSVYNGHDHGGTAPHQGM